jgi:hypothetical protein
MSLGALGAVVVGALGAVVVGAVGAVVVGAVGAVVVGALGAVVVGAVAPVSELAGDCARAAASEKTSSASALHSAMRRVTAWAFPSF